MGATEDAVGHRNRPDVIGLEMRQYFGGYGWVGAGVAGFGEPTPHVGFRVFRKFNSHRDLGSAPVVGTIERDGADRVTTHAAACLLRQSFNRPIHHREFPRVALGPSNTALPRS